MTTLTLARYILETSLMFLDFCRARGSLVAAASFSLALRMRKMGDWVCFTVLHYLISLVLTNYLSADFKILFFVDYKG